VSRAYHPLGEKTKTKNQKPKRGLIKKEEEAIIH
jgi:hypothetical protein